VTYIVAYIVTGSEDITVRLWDIETGKKVTEFRAKVMSSDAANRKVTQNSTLGMLHAMSFSACGTALATGGDDQVFRIWDIQQAIRGKSPVLLWSCLHC
jgi:WD40 repeat protein